ncbi:hypothetical protein Sru01_33800 [Sphaerisporangium rufum]|uniref:Uncharacterized protein n=1 Tax=Sphaerisporangium rufum TaxID=1381558 RepID=A0A919R3I8_9ACTN|nr:hypothetical protein Sru01_33800 [Sphaerisporangium rufum]
MLAVVLGGFLAKPARDRGPASSPSGTPPDLARTGTPPGLLPGSGLPPGLRPAAGPPV